MRAGRGGWTLAALAWGAAFCLASCTRTSASETSAAGEVSRGRASVERYGCDACHAIVRGDEPRIAAAAPLWSVARQSLIAGVLPNTRANLARWILGPRRIKPRTAMPQLDVAPAEARDIAAYLMTLR